MPGTPKERNHRPLAKALLFCAGLALLMTLTVLAQAAEEGVPPQDNDAKAWKADLNLPYYSKYFSRAALTVDDPVLQPNLTVSGYGFSFNAWGNYNLTDKIERKGKFTEVDLTGQYEFELGKFDIPVGVVHYLYPNMTQPNTTEVFVGLGYEAFITPAVKVFQDVGDVHGTFVQGTLTFEQEVLKPNADFTVAVNLNGGVEWASKDYNKYEYNWSVDEDHFLDVNGTISLPIKYKEMLTLTPSYTHAWLTDSAIKEAAGYDDKGFWGLSLTVSF